MEPVCKRVCRIPLGGKVDNIGAWSLFLQMMIYVYLQRRDKNLQE